MPAPFEQLPVPDPSPGPPYASNVVRGRLFSCEECSAIERLVEQLDVETSTVGTDDSGVVVDDYRAGSTSWAPATDPAWRWIYDRIADFALDANADWGFDLDGFAEDLQVATYDAEGDFYTWHQDGLDGGVADRKMAVVVQLSDPDDYDGADLELFSVSTEYTIDAAEAWTETARGRGTAVAFPAWEYHRVTPLTRGRRRSLVGWISGPTFR